MTESDWLDSTNGQFYELKCTHWYRLLIFPENMTRTLQLQGTKSVLKIIEPLRNAFYFHGQEVGVISTDYRR